jgi:hypothetical protein
VRDLPVVGDLAVLVVLPWVVLVVRLRRRAAGPAPRQLRSGPPGREGARSGGTLGPRAAGVGRRAAGGAKDRRDLQQRGLW